MPGPAAFDGGFPAGPEDRRGSGGSPPPASLWVAFPGEGVALRGWVFKVVEWSDVTEAANLKAKAEAYLESVGLIDWE